jgi:hypothetical protein
VTKITDLAALAAGASPADVLPFVDVDDTSMAASGTTKKITAGNLLPFVTLSPSGDTSGAADLANFNAAVTALTGGGVIFLTAGAFYTNARWTLPAQTTAGQSGGNPVSLHGSGPATTIFPVGAAITGVYSHRDVTGYGSQNPPAQHTTGFVRDLVIDGTNATGASIGLDVGDGWGYHVLNVSVVNFTGTGAIGLNHENRLFWSEKNWFQMSFSNNTTACHIGSTTAPSNTSHEYCTWDFYIWANVDQNGMVFDACGTGGSRIMLKGNMARSSNTSGAPTNNIAALSIINAGSIGNSMIEVRLEGNTGNGPAGGVPPYTIYSDGNAASYIKGCAGRIDIGGNGPGLTASALNGIPFVFKGMIFGDAGLSGVFPSAAGGGTTAAGQPAVPASTTPFINYATDMMVYVTGGTVSAVAVSGVTTGQTTGAFFVPAGGSITLTYTVAPTWKWVPAMNSVYF